MKPQAGILQNLTGVSRELDCRRGGHVLTCPRKVGYETSLPEIELRLPLGGAIVDCSSTSNKERWECGSEGARENRGSGRQTKTRKGPEDCLEWPLEHCGGSTTASLSLLRERCPWSNILLNFLFAGCQRTPSMSTWNPDNVRDVAESVGITVLNDEVIVNLARDVEYRISLVLEEALKFMRHGKRTTLTTQDISQALSVLDVEPLYGYDSTRPLRFGEASLGPGQPLFYVEDEEVDFEKLINAPLPKVPREVSFTGEFMRRDSIHPQHRKLSG